MNAHTINDTEFVPEKYSIGVAPELVSDIKKGVKAVIYRFGTKYDYIESGDIVSIQDSSTGKVECRAKVVRKLKMLFSEIPVDLQNHEVYKDKEEQRAIFSGYYAYLGRPIEDTDLFIIFEFELNN